MMRVALVTGGTRGLGRAIVHALAQRGWYVVTDGRRVDSGGTDSGTPVDGFVATIQGDVADPVHRASLRSAVRSKGRLDLLVNNASLLGPSPLQYLRTHSLPELAHLYTVNVLAPVALFQAHRDLLHDSDGMVVNISSDAAVQAYPGWGGYGGSKAALDHISAVLAAEEPDLRVYAFDPGDMNTEMHQQAAPGEDLSALPPPESVVPHVLRLIDERPPSGRYQSMALADRGTASHLKSAG